MARVPLELVLVNKVSAPLKKANADANKFANTIKGTNGKLRSAAMGSKKMAAGFLGIGASAGAAGKAVQLFGQKLNVALLGIPALLGGFAAAFQTIAKQDFAEAKFESLGGNSEKLTNNLKILSAELAGQASVTELTAAAYDVASAGFTDAADAAKILKAASLGATGGFTDINTAGGAAVKVLNAYGKTADDAGFLMDQFAQTQADGIITIGAYSQNIGKVASTAAGLKVPLSEVNAIIAQSTAAGVQTETAFTGLNAALAKISSGQAGKALGIEMNEATLAADGLGGTLEKLKGFSTGELQQAFGIEAFKGIQTAINDTEKFNKLLENQKNAQGAAAKAAFTASDTINNQLKRLGAAFTNIFADQSALGEVLKFTISAVAVTVEALAAALKVVQVIGKGVIGIFQGLAKGLGLTESKMGSVQALTEAWTAQLVKVEIFCQRIIAVSQVLGEIVGKVFRKIGGWVVGAWSQGSQKFTEFKSHIEGNMERMKEIGKGVAKALTAPARLAFKGLQFIFDQWWKKIQWIVDQVMKIPGMKWAIEKMTGAAADISEAWKLGAKGAEEGGGNKGEKQEQEEINKALTKQKDLVAELDKLWKDIGKTIGEGIHSAIKGVVQGTQTLGQAAMNVLNSIANKLLDAGISMALSAVFPNTGAGSIGAFLGFANGGKPPVGKPSIVGEKGPELFVPGTSGTIIPNNKLGGSTNNIVVNVDASGSAVEADSAQSNELGKMLAAAIQAELVKQQRPGGLLAA